ncbi:MAG: T9SS type A sorting domain-containing protein [Bacteroidetes bacterium]|nr:T9SS type A sorting domain-containing protein [Bacteroidota bacterium]
MKRSYTLQVRTILTSLLIVCSHFVFATVTSGTYTIGASGDYANLSNAINDLNSSTITGPVIFNIIPGTYSGSSWQSQINAVSGGSSVNTVTIQAQNGPGTVTISVSGTSSANYVFRINDATYIKIKNLTLKNTSTSYGTIINFINAASHDSIVGCNMIGATGSTTSTNRAIIYATNANDMDGNVISNDTIQNGSYGIYWTGTSSIGSNNHVFNNNKFSNNYYGYIYSSYIGNASIENNTFTATGISGYHYGIYNNFPVNGIKIKNNSITTNTTSGYLYGVYIYYGNYYTTTGSELIVEDNNISLTGTSYVYGINFDYYCYNMRVVGNTLTDNTNSSYNYGIRVYYYCTNLTCTDNNITCTNNGSYSYPWYLYYTNYGNQTNGYCNISNNISNGVNNSTSGYVYATYMYANYNMEVHNNVFNATTKYYMYNYGPLYYGYNSTATDNTFNFTNNGTGYIYNYCSNIYNPNTTQDTFANNTFNIQSTSSGSISNYACYYVSPSSLVKENTYNISVKNGTLYNYSYYGNGGTIQNNKFNLSSTTGTIYGNYSYNYSSYSGAKWLGNIFDLSSNTGTLYAFGGYLPGQDKFINNIFTTKTAGASYLWYESPSYGAQTDLYFFNNTFHSNSTGSTDYLIYKTGGVSYAGRNYFFNNIFSSSNPSGTNGVIIRDTNKFVADYNLYYSSNNTVNFQSQTFPSINTSAFNTWRSTANRDRNSLIYNPGFVNSGNKDFHPSPTDPNSWSVQGRGLHLPADTFDLTGAPRAKTRQDGVPDLGAYEFTPTSTPPNCIAIPTNPIPNAKQVFIFGYDTVAAITWGATVPASASMQQYTGLQAPSPMPTAVGRGYIYTKLNTSGNFTYQHTPTLYYKDAWLGNISNETNTKIARSSNNGIWEGYNYSNGITDSILNQAYPLNQLDSVGDYTIVENARIGIRCIQAPSNITISNITAFSADVTWDGVFLPIGYQILVDTKSGTPTSATGALFSTTNSIALTSLNENTHYYIHIRNICGLKDTSAWSTVPLTTIITCHTPIVKFTGINNSRAIAYWDTIQTATRYEYVITHSPTPVPSFGTPTTVNSTFINIVPGKDYYVFVRAYCNGIYPNSEWGMGSFTVFPTGIGNATNDVRILVYPNPADDVLNVSIDKYVPDSEIVITDLMGKVVFTYKVEKETTSIPIKQLSKGLYILKYNFNNTTTIVKFNKI